MRNHGKIKIYASTGYLKVTIIQGHQILLLAHFEHFTGFNFYYFTQKNIRIQYKASQSQVQNSFKRLFWGQSSCSIQNSSYPCFSDNIHYNEPVDGEFEDITATVLNGLREDEDEEIDTTEDEDKDDEEDEDTQDFPP